MGESQRHMGTQTDITARHLNIFHRELIVRNSEDDRVAYPCKSATRSRWWWHKHLGVDLYLGYIFDEVRDFSIQGTRECLLMVL